MWVRVGSAPAAGGTIYYSPGYGITGHDYSQCPVLYSTDGLISTFVWSGGELETIGCLFYTALTQKVYMLVYGRGMSANTVKVYHWAEGGTPELLNTLSYYPYKPIQACEFEGQIYVWANDSYNYMPRVEHLNLDTGVMDTRLVIPSDASSNYAYGGIGSDGTALFASDGGFVYRTTDPVVGPWDLVWSWDGFYFPWLGGFASSEQQGKVYCGCSSSDSYEEGLLPGIYEVSASGLSLVAARPAFGVGIAGLVHRQSGGVQSGLVGLTASRVSLTEPLYEYDGGWSALGEPWFAVERPHPMTSRGGNVYQLVATNPYVPPAWDHWRVYLLKDGVEVAMHDWMGPSDSQAMTVCTTDLKCHEV